MPGRYEVGVVCDLSIRCVVVLYSLQSFLVLTGIISFPYILGFIFELESSFLD